MSSLDIFTRSGLYVARNFAGPEWCASLRAEMKLSTNAPTRVWQKSSFVLDGEKRKSSTAFVSDAALARVKARMEGVKPDIERHFGLTLTGLEKVQFLMYREGDFFQVHRDSSNKAGDSPDAHERKISTVLFLNGSSDEPVGDSYQGGSFVFYELLSDPQLSGIGFPLAGEEGLLVAFPSTMPHQVSPITKGVRYSVAGWYY